MKKILTLAFLGIAMGGFCAPDEIYDDGFYVTQEPAESPPIYVCDVPTYSYRMRCEEKEVPVRKLCCRPVQRQYEVQRVKYVPQVYTETITRTEIEYYYVNACDVRQNWVCDRNCEYTPQYFRGTPCPSENNMTPRCGERIKKRCPRNLGCR